MTSKVYTLITGASMGIGRAIAEECASRNFHLLLVALPGEELEATVDQLKNKYPVDIHHLGLDLTHSEAAQEVLAYCQANQLAVNMLINNAGFGSSGAFDTAKSAFYEKMIQLNVLNTVVLTRLFIPELQKHQSAYILNTGSAAAFFDMPYKLVYSATKSFVYSFSRALRMELRSYTNISVSVICPAGVTTNEEVRQRTQQMGWVAVKTSLEPEFVAKQAINGMLARKALILPGLVAKIYFIASKVIPYQLKMSILTRIYKKAA